MCLSIPGLVVRVGDGSVEVDYGSVRVTARTLAVKPELGDYVLVQGKQVVHVFDPAKAREILSEVESVLSP